MRGAISASSSQDLGPTRGEAALVAHVRGPHGGRTRRSVSAQSQRLGLPSAFDLQAAAIVPVASRTDLIQVLFEPAHESSSTPTGAPDRTRSRSSVMLPELGEPVERQDAVWRQRVGEAASCLAEECVVLIG